MTLTDAFEKVFILTLPGAEERRAVLEGHLREVGIVARGSIALQTSPNACSHGQSSDRLARHV